MSKKIKIKDLIPDEANFNKGNAFGESLIEKSFDKFGAGRSILIDKNNRIIAGNKSTQKFVEQGGENVVIVETDGKTLVAVKRNDIDLNTKRGREMALADNATAKANIEWDFENLHEWEMPLEDWGIVDFETVEPIEEDESTVAETISKAKELQEKWGTKEGQLWKLGEHRLLIADATIRANIERLFDGESASVVFADPPYGIAHSGKGIKGATEANDFGQILNDADIETAQDAFLLSRNLFYKARQIWWGANYYPSVLPDNFGWLVWDKEKEGDTFSGAELAFVNYGVKVDIFRHQWHGMIKASEHGEARLHPTQKPVALAEWCFEKYGNENDLIFDPFLGSGISMIAAERTRGKVYGCELSVDYAACILERWANLTGKTPELIDE